MSTQGGRWSNKPDLSTQFGNAPSLVKMHFFNLSGTVSAQKSSNADCSD